MKEVVCPNDYSKYRQYKLLCSGSIQSSDKWIMDIKRDLNDYNVILLNPRAIYPEGITVDDWNEYYKKCMNWVLDAQDNADFIIFNFLSFNNPDEIDFATMGFNKLKHIVVMYDDNFIYRDYIDMVCEKYYIHNVHSYEDLIKYMNEMFKNDVLYNGIKDIKDEN